MDLLVLFIDLVFFLLKSQLRSTNLSWKLRGSKKTFFAFFLFSVYFWCCGFLGMCFWVLSERVWELGLFVGVSGWWGWKLSGVWEIRRGGRDEKWPRVECVKGPDGRGSLVSVSCVKTAGVSGLLVAENGRGEGFGLRGLYRGLSRFVDGGLSWGLEGGEG